MHHASRVLHCSQLNNRASIMEFRFSETSAVLSSIDKLPPAYDQLLHRLASEGDQVFDLPINRIDFGNHGCPHCGLDDFVRCGQCGSFFCDVRSALHRSCPQCGSIIARESIKQMESLSASTHGVTDENHELIRQKKLEAARGVFRRLPSTSKQQAIEPPQRKLLR